MPRIPNLEAVGLWSWLGKIKEENNVCKDFEDPYLKPQFLIQWKLHIVTTMWKLPVYFQLLARHPAL